MDTRSLVRRLYRTHIPIDHRLVYFSVTLQDLYKTDTNHRIALGTCSIALPRHMARLVVDYWVRVLLKSRVGRAKRSPPRIGADVLLAVGFASLCPP